jgi:hypothetical protein
MADYININGNNIPIRASDPSNPIVGEIWYNSTTNLLKGQAVTTVGSFSTAPNLNNIHLASGASGTSATSALVFGNSAPGIPAKNTESYDGSTWTNVNPSVQDMDYSNGFGTQTSAVAAGDGGPVGANSTSLWDGTSWTNSNPTTTYSYARVGLGTGTSLGALYGGTPYTAPSTTVEEWNGTSWTAGTGLPNGGANSGAAGLVTAALIFGGSEGPTAQNKTLSWNGSAWSSLNTLNSARADGAGSGVQGNALFAGGGPGTSSAAEIWDGTCWSTNPNSLNSARAAVPNTMASPTNSSTLVAGGSSASSPGLLTEEYTGPGVAVTQTISSS